MSKSELTTGLYPLWVTGWKWRDVSTLERRGLMIMNVSKVGLLPTFDTFFLYRAMFL